MTEFVIWRLDADDDADADADLFAGGSPTRSRALDGPGVGGPIPTRPAGGGDEGDADGLA